MDAVAPNWYPDPQRDGMLRWWDGTRWTEHVQPARAAGKPVLGQEVTGGIGPVTWYGPNEPVTHAFAPITDERYAGSPLAELLAEQSRSASGDVQVSAEHHAAVEAAYQLRKKGGVLGSIAGLGEQLLVDAINGAVPARATTSASTPGPDGVVAYGAGPPVTWSPTGPAPESDAGLVAPRPPVESPWMQPEVPQAQFQAASVAIRGAATVVGMVGLIGSLVGAVVVVLVGLVAAIAVPVGEGPGWLLWTFPLLGAVGVVLAVKAIVDRLRTSRL